MLKHVFLYNADDAPALFSECEKMSTFCSRLEKQAKDNDRDDEEYRDYVGAGFELFVEVLLTLFPNDTRLGGLSEYEPIQVDDTGADGRALNFNGLPSMVQVKYKSDKTMLLSANKNRLGNMVVAGQFEGIPLAVNEEEASRYFVFTTAAGLHPFTKDKFFRNYVKCVGWDTLRRIVDSNVGFLQDALNLVNQSYE